MSSPAKKRKLNNDSKTSTAPVKGLEYFFRKQRENASAESTLSAVEAPSRPTSELTDEELARKLQDEWNQESATERRQADESDSSTPKVEDPNGQSTKDRVPDETKNSQTPNVTAERPEDKGPKTLALQSAGMSEDSVTSTIPFDESPLTFDPSKYVGQLQELWGSEGGNATYALLTRCFVIICATTSRIKIVDTLVNCLRVLIEGDPSSLLPAVSGFWPRLVRTSLIPDRFG